MRRLRAWGLGTTLLLAAGAAVLAADDAKAPLSRAGWDSWGNTTKKPEVKKKVEEPKAKAGPVTPPQPSQREVVERMRGEEEAKLLRRQEVCDRLRRIALDTQDADLDRQAAELDQRSQSLYNERAATLKADVARLGKKLPADGGADKLTSPARGAGRKADAATASVQEVNP